MPGTQLKHDDYLDAACALAKQSVADGGVGAGAVMVKAGEIIARSHDRTIQLGDPVAVAEVDCIRQAGRRSDQPELTLYSTRYPDMLCAGTVLQFSIGSLVIGLSPTDSAEIALLKSRNVPVIFHPYQPCQELIQA